MESFALFALGFAVGLAIAGFAKFMGDRLREARHSQTSILPPAGAQVSYVDAIADTPGATWVDQVVGCLADYDELTLAHELRQRIDRALATLRALARPDATGAPCWCSNPSQRAADGSTTAVHSRVCTTAAATVASLSAPPFPRAPIVQATPGRYDQH